MKKLLILTAAIVGMCFVQAAEASTMITLNEINTPIGGNGPFADVTYDLLNSTTASFTFTARTGYQFGDGSAIGLNVNATTIGYTFGSVTPTGVVLTRVDTSGNGNPAQVDGIGDFNFQLTTGDFGAGHTFTSVTFTLSNGSGTWATVNDILALNAEGHSAEAHVRGTGVLTGFATAGGGSVPDGGSTIALLGLAMLGLGSVRRVFSKK